MISEEVNITSIPVREIFADHDFNCRGPIDGRSVVELSESIAAHGLLQPILVQPFGKSDDPKIKYRIVAGYRRFFACRAVGMTEIPSIVKEGLSEDQARILNLTENLKRKELNIMQEAFAIKPFLDKGLIEREITEQLGVSRGWFQNRKMALTLPKSIQEEIAVGNLNTTDIKKCYELQTPELQFEYVKEVKRRRMKVGRRENINLDTIRKPVNKSRVRTTEEISDMVVLLVRTLGPSVGTVALAWAAGNVDDFEVHLKIKNEATRQGKWYEIPEHIALSKGSQSMKLAAEG